jgi:histidinol-phosphatase (PHP family)
MQKFNYHTHTYRCKHAVGTDQEYVLAAINAGLTTLGFSDHCPYPDFKMHDRMDYDEFDGYLKSLNSLKIKYKDQIDIKIGLECEYFEDFLEYYKFLATKVDYLILGQHYSAIDGIDYWNKCTDEDMDSYTDAVIKGLNTGLFKYYAHPDYVLISRDTYNLKLQKAFEKIFKVAKENDVIVEINLKGKRLGKKVINGKEQYIYPFREVFEIVSNYNCKCAYGQDTHNPAFFKDFYQDIDEVKNILKGIDLNIVEEIDI